MPWWIRKPPIKGAAKWPVDRPLSDYEKQHYVSQKEQSISPPWYQLSVIKMNSTFLECTDNLFGDKGMSAFVAILLIGGFAGITLFAIVDTILKWFFLLEKDRLAGDLSGVALFAGATAWTIFLFKEALMQDCFCYTHYPIRFNRKNRKVYAFRSDGTMMEADWDKLFVTVAIIPNLTGRGNEHEIRINRMAEDGETVLDTYALPWRSSDEETLYPQWEFVRRYMEEPEELSHLAGQVVFVMDVAERRETWWWGFKRMLSETSGPVAILYIIMAPFMFVPSIARWFAMHTCAIPQWPAEVEAECQIEPNDPYLRDRDHLAAPGTVERPPLPR